MRNPYIVGDPVMGQDFYGREAIIETICGRRDRAVHVMGMRRIGKTSFLRQLESQLPGLFLDFQAVVGRTDLTRQVQRGLRRLSRRLPWLPPLDEGKSAFELLEDADERAEVEGASLWLLCDEAEGLIDLCEQDSEALKMLRGVIWGGRAIRTVLASAKNLVKLDDLCQEWHTSPFLSNFPPPFYLGGLTDEASDALITQSQSESPVRAALELYAEIRRLTNNHPYLIQWLCRCLWQPDNTLRPVTSRDLEPDEHLAARLRMDFDYLSDTERRILHVVSTADGIAEPQLQGHISHPRLSTFLHGLTQLGYLRREVDSYTVGNAFFARWLHEWAPWGEKSRVSDEGMLNLHKEGSDDMSTDPALQQWAMSILTTATTWLFTQASEVLKERREKRQAERKLTAPSAEPKPAMPSPITTADDLLSELRHKADLTARRTDVETVKSLMKRLKKRTAKINRYREKEAGGLGLDDQVLFDERIETEQEKVAQEAEEMRLILERLAGRPLQIPNSEQI